MIHEIVLMLFVTAGLGMISLGSYFIITSIKGERKKVVKYV